jgi:hypothetical protein
MIAVGEAEAPPSSMHHGRSAEKGVKVFSYTEGNPSSNSMPRRHIGPVRFLLETVLHRYPGNNRSDAYNSEQHTPWQLQLQIKTSDPEYLSEFVKLLNFGATFQLAETRSSKTDEVQLARLLGLCSDEANSGGFDEEEEERFV